MLGRFDEKSYLIVSEVLSLRDTTITVVLLHYEHIVLDHVRLYLANKIAATVTKLNLGQSMTLSIMQLVLRRPMYAPYLC